MKLFLSILAVLFSLTLMAQESYWKNYTTNDPDLPSGYSINNTSDSAIIINANFGNDRTFFMKEKNNNIVFCRSYEMIQNGMRINDYVELPDKGFIASGRTNSGALYVMRLESDGDLRWGKNYNITYSQYSSSIVKYSTPGKYIMVGGSMDNIGVFIVDTNGVLHSGKNIINTLDGAKIINTHDNGFLIMGKTQYVGNGGFDLVLIKLDSAANIKWSRTFGTTAHDLGNSIIHSISGGYLITGTTTCLDSEGDIFVCELDVNFNILWTKIYSRPGSIYPNSTKIYLDSLYSISNKNKTTSDFDAGMITISQSGRLKWSMRYDNPGNDSGDDFIVTGDNQLLMIINDENSSTNDNISLLKLNRKGKTGCDGIELPMVEVDTLFDMISQKFSYDSHNMNTSNPAHLLIGKNVFRDTVCYCYDTLISEIKVLSCYTDSVHFQPILTDTSYIRVKWEFGDGDTSNQLSPAHVYPSQGTYYADLSVYENSGCISHKRIKVKYKPYDPNNSFTYVTVNLAATFEDPTDIATNWHWVFGDGHYDSVCNPVHFYDSSGTYYVCLISSNICGSDTMCDSVTVIHTGIAELPEKQTETLVYPNPTNGSNTISIRSFNKEISTVNIYNLLGELVISDEKLRSKKVSIVADKLKSGSYIIEILDLQGVTIGRHQIIMN